MVRMIRLISIRPITVPPEDFAKWTLERMNTQWFNLNQTDLWMMKKGRCSRKKMESLGRSPCLCLCSRLLNPSQIQISRQWPWPPYWDSEQHARCLNSWRSFWASSVSILQWAQENFKENPDFLFPFVCWSSKELESLVLSKNSSTLPCDAWSKFLNWSKMTNNSS